MFSSFNFYGITPTQFLDATDRPHLRRTAQFQELLSVKRAPHSIPVLLLWKKKNKISIQKAKFCQNSVEVETLCSFPNTTQKRQGLKTEGLDILL